MKSLLSSLLSPDPNSSSAMRFVMLFCVVIIFLVWAFACIKKQELIDLPQNIDYALLVLIGGKAAQKIFGEQPDKPESVQNVTAQAQTAVAVPASTGQ